jgi:hypothetical protein
VVRPSLNPAQIRPLPLIAGAWIAFLCAAWLLRRVPLRASVMLILLGGIAIQLAAVSAPPQNSDDLYRYIWDGRVQAAGIDPYAYVPLARQLTGLRDEFLWHPGARYCVTPAYVWDATPGSHTLKVRTTDKTGHTQTAVAHGPEPNGATGYHTIGVTVG